MTSVPLVCPPPQQILAGQAGGPGSAETKFGELLKIPGGGFVVQRPWLFPDGSVTRCFRWK
jgi:hypothetical protein